MGNLWDNTRFLFSIQCITFTTCPQLFLTISSIQELSTPTLITTTDTEQNSTPPTRMLPIRNNLNTRQNSSRAIEPHFFGSCLHICSSTKRERGDRDPWRHSYSMQFSKNHVEKYISYLSYYTKYPRIFYKASKQL